MGLKKGSQAVIGFDMQGDLASSLIGRRCIVLGRVRENDVDDDKAYAVLPEGRKNPRTVWESELNKQNVRRRKR